MLSILQRESLTCFTCQGNQIIWPMTQNFKIMKTKVLVSALATVAMLIGGTSTATAQGVRRHDMRGTRHHMERRFDNRHFDHRCPGPRHIDYRLGPVHRPIMGARFFKRPGYGRFITHNRERLLLANGVLYREVRTPNGFVYIVVGYI